MQERRKKGKRKAIEFSSLPRERGPVSHSPSTKDRGEKKNPVGTTGGGKKGGRQGKNCLTHVSWSTSPKGESALHVAKVKEKGTEGKRRALLLPAGGKFLAGKIIGRRSEKGKRKEGRLSCTKRHASRPEKRKNARCQEKKRGKGRPSVPPKVPGLLHRVQDQNGGGGKGNRTPRVSAEKKTALASLVGRKKIASLRTNRGTE